MSLIFWILWFSLVQIVRANIVSPLSKRDADKLTTSNEVGSVPGRGLCRRWDHRTAIVKDKLYLLGGRLMDKELIGDKLKFDGFYVDEFISLDLTKTFNVGYKVNSATSGKDYPAWSAVDYTISAASDYNPTRMDNSNFSGYPANSLNTPRINFSGGVLWTVNDSLVLMDGVRYYDNLSDPSTLWTFDTLTGEWDLKQTYDVPAAEGQPKRYYRGGYTHSDPQLNNGWTTGFRVGGARVEEPDWQIDEPGEKSYWYGPDEQMLRVDLGGEWRKLATTLDSSARSVGAAVSWLPIGDQGSLVVIGGTDEKNTRDDRAKVTSLVTNSEDIRVYDIAHGKWYSQTATAAREDKKEEDIPHNRMDACTVTVSAPDKSWHVIYMYGGGTGSGMYHTPNDESYYGDLYMLFLPAFRWYNAVREQKDGLTPYHRTRHRCHRVGNKMMVIGGTSNDEYLTTDNQTFPSFTNHSCIYDEIHVLDLSTLQWQARWRGDKDSEGDRFSLPYTVNYTKPEHGWSNTDLEVLFERKGPIATSNGQDEDKSAGRTVRKEYIVIGVVFGVLFLVAVIFVLWWFWKKRGRKANEIAAAGLLNGNGGEATREPEKKTLQVGTGDKTVSEMPAENVTADRRATQSTVSELDSRTVSELYGHSPGTPGTVNSRVSSMTTKPESPLFGSPSTTGAASQTPRFSAIYEME